MCLTLHCYLDMILKKLVESGGSDLIALDSIAKIRVDLLIVYIGQTWIDRAYKSTSLNSYS